MLLVAERGGTHVGRSAAAPRCRLPDRRAPERSSATAQRAPPALQAATTHRISLFACPIMSLVVLAIVFAGRWSAGRPIRPTPPCRRAKSQQSAPSHARRHQLTLRTAAGAQTGLQKGGHQTFARLRRNTALRRLSWHRMHRTRSCPSVGRAIGRLGPLCAWGEPQSLQAPTASHARSTCRASAPPWVEDALRQAYKGKGSRKRLQLA